MSPQASLSVRLGFSISIRSLLGSRASLGASLRSSLDEAVPTVPAWHSAEQNLGTAWGWVLTSSHSNAKLHAAGGVPILLGTRLLRASQRGCRAQGRELLGWEGSV